MTMLGSKKHLTMFLLSRYWQLSKEHLYKMLNIRDKYDRINYDKELAYLKQHGLIWEIYPNVFILTAKGIGELRTLDNRKLHQQIGEIISEIRKEGWEK